MILIALIFVYFCSETSCTHLAPVLEDSHESVGKCTVTIADKYFTDIPNINLFLINSSRDDELLSLIYTSRNHKKTIRDLTKFKVNYYDIKRRYSIVAAESLDELLLYRHQFFNLNLWNARSRYIFIVRQYSAEKMQQTVEFLWDNYIINALIMMPSELNETVQEIYSWFPYENGSCGEDIKARLVDLCEYGRFEQNVDLYPPKLPDVVNFCPIRARAIVWPPLVMPPDDNIIIDDVPLNITQGVDIMLLKTATQIMNINALITSSTTKDNWGIGTVDGNVTGNIQAVVLRQIDMTFGAYGPMLERRMFCDFTTSHYNEGITWCVPRAQLAPKWRNLLDTFLYETWLSMIAAYFMVSTIVWYCCSCEPRDVTSYTLIQDSLKYLFSVFLAVSVSMTPKKFSSRIVFFVWVVFSLHFVAAYQAKLISVLLSPTYETQINSVEEILAKQMDWGAVPSLKRFYVDKEDWRVRYLFENWKACPDADACLHRIAYKRDFALIIMSVHAEYEVLSYLDANSQSRIYCFPKVYLVYPSEMYMRKGFPFQDRLNQLILRIKDAGFIFKWMNDLQYREFIRQLRIANEQHPREQTQKLTLDHLQGAFMIWALGYGSAILAFIGEFVYYKVKEEHLMKKRLFLK